MMRRALRVSSVARPSSWLIVAVGLTLYVALMWEFPAAQGWPQAPLPWWLAQAGVPVVYAVLIGVSVRRASWPRLFGATALLWTGHLLVGVVAGAMSGLLPSAVEPTAVMGFSPLLLPQLLWVPLLLIPFHDVIVGDGRSRRNGRGGQDRGPIRTRRDGAPMAAPVTPVGAPLALPPANARSGERATTDMAERRSEVGARPTPLARVESAEGRFGATASPSRVLAPAVAETPPAHRVLGEMLARETSDDVVRVSFARIADQLPAAVFSLPLDRVAASLRDPGYLLVSRRLVLTQLAEGLVRAGWETVAEQFPRHLLALSDAEITRGLRDSQLVLPLDELVPQLPPELFRVPTPLVVLRGIENFPEPFKRVGPVPGESRPAPIAAAVSSSIAEAGVVPDPPPVSTTPDLLEDEGAARGDARTFSAVAAAGAAPLRGDEGASGVVTMPAAESLPFLASGERPGARMSGSDEAPVPVDERVDGPATESIAGPPPVGPVGTDDLAVALDVAALLAPVGPFNVTVDADDDVTFLSMSSAGLAGPGAVAAARLVLRILTDGRTPWPIDQLTLRGVEDACVLTPLPPVRQRGRVLMATVPPQGSLALLEILCRRAAARHGGQGEPLLPEGAGGHDCRLLEVEPSTLIREVGASLSAVGPVLARAFRDAEAETVLCLFLPAECDARATAGFAHDLARTMRRATASGMPWKSAVLGGGGRRLMLRLPDLAGGCADIIIVAGGRIDRRGLAYRQVESAARALRAG